MKTYINKRPVVSAVQFLPHDPIPKGVDNIYVVNSVSVAEEDTLEGTVSLKNGTRLIVQSYDWLISYDNKDDGIYDEVLPDPVFKHMYQEVENPMKDYTEIPGIGNKTKKLTFDKAWLPSESINEVRMRVTRKDLIDGIHTLFCKDKDGVEHIIEFIPIVEEE